jgi:hypothetical protein
MKQRTLRFSVVPIRCSAEASQLLSCGYAPYRAPPTRPADLPLCAGQNRLPATLMEFLAPTTHEPERVHFSPVCLTGYVPSSGFRTLPSGYSSPRRPTLFQAGSALGVFALQGLPPTARSRGLVVSRNCPRGVASSFALPRSSGSRRPSQVSRTCADLFPPSGPCSSSGSVPHAGLF